MAKKQFKIGECAIGGIIAVEINGKHITIKALDYSTKKEVSSNSFICNENGVGGRIDDYLNDLTTSYYADKILTWIKGAITYPF